MNNAFGVFDGQDKRDLGVWQKQIDARYLLEIDGKNISLHDGNDLVLRFVWEGIVEIQSLRREEFPPMMWKIISRMGKYLLPQGGRYAEEFERRMIRTLPGYHEQQAVKLDPPAGYTQALSLWRANDSLPRRLRTDFDDDLEI